MSQINKNSKIGICISFLLLAITIIDKIILKGVINFYIHTPVTYIVIFLIHFSIIRQEWGTISVLLYKLKEKLTKKNIKKVLLFLAPFILLILLRGKLNEFLINQNIFNFDYKWIRLLLNLQFLAKTVILFIGSFGVAFFANLLNNSKPVVKLSSNKKNFLLLSIILIIFFIAFKLYFVYAYSGNYQDDWYNIVAGEDFFKTGEFIKVNQYFGKAGYSRGAYMTVLTNFFMLVFGRSVNSAQLAPAFIGLTSFILLLFISKKVLKNNISVILFSLLYITNPFIIFNHLFIRMYVFYELFFLLITLLVIYIYRNLHTKNKGKSLLGISFLTILNIIIWVFTKDKSVIIFPIYSLIGVSIAMYKAGFLKIVLSQLSNSFKKKKSPILLVVLLLIICALLIKFFPWNSIRQIYMSSTNDGSNRNSLIKLICYTFSPLVLFVFLSFTTLKRQTISKQLLITFSFIALILHLLLPQNYQVIRGFSYIWGPLYLTSLMFVSHLTEYISNIKNSQIFIFLTYSIFGLFLLIPSIRSYSNSYLLYGPNISGEVAYYEFDNTFNYLKSNHNDKILVESSYNLVPDMFYDLPAKYLLDLDGRLEESYFPPQVKHVTSISQLEEIRSKSDVCIVLRDYSHKVLLPSYFMSYLINNYYLDESTIGYRIWCERDLLD